MRSRRIGADVTFPGARALGQAAASQVHPLSIMGQGSSPALSVRQVLREAHDEHHGEEHLDEYGEEHQERRDEAVEEAVENTSLNKTD